MEGKSNGITIIMMMDSKASHNFISPQVIFAFEILINPTREIGIRLGDNHKVITRGLGKDRDGLGRDEHELHHHGKPIQLKGLSTNVVCDEECAYGCQDLLNVLDEFGGVFKELMRLPLKRDIEHVIDLQPGVEPMSDELNKACKYPIPVVDELLNELNRACYISKLDLKSRYHQIWVREGDIHKRHFRTHEEHYEYPVTSGAFGSCNFKFKSYSGPYKGYRKLAKPLTELTKKEGFHWGLEALLAFEGLKEALTSALVLALPNFTQAFKIECDAFERGIEVGRPIAYVSKPLSDRNLSKIVYEKELIALLAVQHWRCYFIGRRLISSPIWEQGNELQRKVLVDPKLKKIVKDLQEFHSTPMGGHFRFLRRYRRISRNVYWIKIKKIQEFVKTCGVCQSQKYLATSPCGLLHPLPIPTQSKGFDVIFVVADCLSKYVHFGLLKHPYTTRGVAVVFAWEVVMMHGISHSILSDRQLRPVLFKLQGIVLKMSSFYHFETNGQTKVINRCLETYLRCFASEQPKSWSYWLSWAEFLYNTTFHISIAMTPFEVVYGRKPPSVIQFFSRETKVEVVAREL
ncbi:hypothetical protein CR513_18045, partial [Mucuna pruriens]